MDVSRIKASITRSRDIEAIREIISHAKARIYAIEAEKHAAGVAAAWAAVKGLEIGTVLYINAEGTFLGGPWQRGDAVRLTHIQPRAKRIWTENDGKSYWFDARGVYRYALKTTPPSNPLPKEEREMVSRVFGRIAELHAQA